MLKVSSTIAFAITLLVNALANILPINGLNTGEVSNLYPSLFTPAGITFSIWSVLYLLQIAFVVFLWTTKETHVSKLLPAFIFVCMLNACWILLWHYLHPGFSVVIMLCMLATLTYIFLQIQGLFNTKKEYVLVVLPFTLYFAWICVATIANISAWLVSFSWTGFGIAPETWTVVMMIVAAALAFYVSLKFRAPAFTLVVIWALVGIYLRWKQSEWIIIANTAIALCLILTGVFIYGIRKVFRVKIDKDA